MENNKIGIYLDQNGSNLPLLPKFLSTWIWTPDIISFKKAITDFFKDHKELPSLISINHDLTDEHVSLELRRGSKPIYYEMYKSDTGLHCMKWLIEFCIENKTHLNRVMVHGLNATGNQHIINMCNEYYKMCGDTKNSCFTQKWEYEK